MGNENKYQHQTETARGQIVLDISVSGAMSDKRESRIFENQSREVRSIGGGDGVQTRDITES